MKNEREPRPIHVEYYGKSEFAGTHTDREIKLLKVNRPITADEAIQIFDGTPGVLLSDIYQMLIESTTLTALQAKNYLTWMRYQASQGFDNFRRSYVIIRIHQPKSVNTFFSLQSLEMMYDTPRHRRIPQDMYELLRSLIYYQKEGIKESLPEDFPLDKLSLPDRLPRGQE